MTATVRELVEDGGLLLRSLGGLHPESSAFWLFQCVS